MTSEYSPADAATGKDCRARDKRPQVRMEHRILLILAIIFHLSLLVSWRTGIWNRFSFDTTATHGRKGWDFYALYQAGYNALHGISIYEPDTSSYPLVVPVHTPYRYLPLPALALGTPLNLLTPVAALWVWCVFLEIILVIGCLISWRMAKSADEGIILVVFWLFYTPFYLELYMGQFNLVQAMLIFALILSNNALQNIRYDLLWLVSLLWKQMTALFSPLWIIWHRWRGLVIVVAGVLVTSLPYFLVFPASWLEFKRNFAVLPSSQLGNLGIIQFLYAIISAAQPGLSPSLIKIFLYGWIGLVVFVSLRSTYRARKAPPVWHLMLWTTVFFLIYTDIWEHHYVILLPVLVTLYHHTKSPFVLIVYVLLAIWTPYRLVDSSGLAAYDMAMRWTPLAPSWVNIAYHSCKALPVIGLWIYLIRRMADISRYLMAE